MMNAPSAIMKMARVAPMPMPAFAPVDRDGGGAGGSDGARAGVVELDTDGCELNGELENVEDSVNSVSGGVLSDVVVLEEETAMPNPPFVTWGPLAVDGGGSSDTTKLSTSQEETGVSPIFWNDGVTIEVTICVEGGGRGGEDDEEGNNEVAIGRSAMMIELQLGMHTLYFCVCPTKPCVERWHSILE
jgi:hypothetical protein